ncbi:Far1 [Hordeum vulgare]|nr:Far1 [Hordeum vulgare]
MDTTDGAVETADAAVETVALETGEAAKMMTALEIGEAAKTTVALETGRNFLGSHTVDSYGAIINLVGSPPLMVNGTTLTLEHVMQRLDAIENKIATIELIEGLDRKIHNQITQSGSKVGNLLKSLREKEPIVNDSSRIGKTEDVITNLGSAFAAVQNTPNLTLKKTVKSVFVPKASGESSNKDEDLKIINDHTTYGLSTKDDYT